MGEPNEDPFLDDPEALEDEIDLDALSGSDAAEPANDRPAGPGVEALIAERDEMRDRLMRSLAEAENVRKRAQRDRTESDRYGGSRIARDLLPVYDNLRRALAAVGEGEGTTSAIAEGIELTLRELRAVFEKHGVSVIAPAEGDRFDPQVHQAMFEAPLPGTRAGDVIQVMTEGFMLHDRLLRPAQVGVSSTPVQAA